ncbi:hypothetical protein EPN29_12665 [bacterium]|nr:MAG: hypothetical protein EPN29_12665 [bacterium]
MGAALLGVVAGGVAGVLVFAAFVGLGLLLMSRVSNAIPVVILALAGAYAGWLLGVIVFGAVRGADVEAQGGPR